MLALALVLTPALGHASEGLKLPPKALGGWCMAAFGNQCTWGHRANILLPGGFQADAKIYPNPQNWAGQAFPKGVWFTMGGEGVGTINPQACFDIPEIERQAKLAGATAIGFDIEGCYDDRLDDLVDAIKAHKPDMPLMYIPLGDLVVKPKYEDLKETFDFIAPMLYYGENSYQGNGITCVRIKQWVQEWHEAGWPVRKMYLTFQSQSAANDERGQAVLRCLAEETHRERYLGLIGWPSFSKQVNKDNLKLISRTWKLMD